MTAPEAATANTPNVEGRDWHRIALWLVSTTLVYNVIEAGLALWIGSEAESIALLGFGLDSLIETAAAVMLLWRLSLETRGSPPERIEAAEHTVHRFVGVTFLLLATYVAMQSSWTLIAREPPSETWAGIALAGLSLVLMPLVSWAKLHAAREIGSAALRAEAKETLACSFLSFTLLLGLAANALAGWWWADPIAALGMVPWLTKEGFEGLRGETCDSHGD